MRIFWLAFVALAGATSANATAERISGPATVIDGDTMLISGVSVSLSGIDAPELGQACSRGLQMWQCGEEASSLLAKLVSNSQVSCVSANAAPGGLMLAKCERDGLDLALAILEAGFAIANNDAPERYRSVEAQRKASAVGIWAGEFEQPDEWRSKNAPPPAPPPTITTAVRESARQPQRARERSYTNQYGCAIKGNRSRRGEWIYHLPGRPYYDQTRPEALFCTEAEARRAGYRRSKA